MIKGKYQNQGCKSFIIILLLLSSSKCCLPINEQQAKLITTYFEQTYVLIFKIKKLIRERINGSLIVKVLKIKQKCLQHAATSRNDLTFSFISQECDFFQTIQRYCKIA